MFNVLDDDPNTVLFVARGNGNGSFQTAQQYMPGIFIYQALIGDFNGDGRPDIVAGEKVPVR